MFSSKRDHRSEESLFLSSRLAQKSTTVHDSAVEFSASFIRTGYF